MIPRDYIVAELRRTAAENDGIPVGRERFAALTGIRESDWSGRYWARWSEAIAEAGLIANALQGRYDDDLVIGRLVPVIRRLGRMPTTAEVRLERRHDPSFPSAGVFAKFGNRRAVVERVADYYRARPGCGDVLPLLAPILAAGGATTRLVGAEPVVTMGEVYMLKVGRHYKIGRTNAVGRREYELGIQLPERGVLIHVIKTDDPPGIEAYWHRRFADHRGNGEWFALTAADVAAFRRRKFM